MDISVSTRALPRASTVMSCALRGFFFETRSHGFVRLSHTFSLFSSLLEIHNIFLDHIIFLLLDLDLDMDWNANA